VKNSPNKLERITLKCGHCKRTVSFAKDWAGRMGRCPHCQEILDIPGQAPPADAAPDLDSFSAGSDSSLDALDLATLRKNRADETDILPAQQEAEMAIDPADRPADVDQTWLRTHRTQRASQRRGQRAQQTLLWGVLALVTAAIVTGGLLLLLRR
jgi:hypothetical protein